jgi:hypothetical protein
MLAAIFVTVLGIGEPPAEVLPVDRAMAAIESRLPRLKELQAEAEEDIARLGPVESDWANSGTTAAAVIAAAPGNIADYVLGEWEKGVHSVTIAGDHPLAAPPGWHRYNVRGYSGLIDQHAYHRLSSDIVLHTFGTGTRIGNAACRPTQGVELISRDPWRSWSPETALLAFAMAKATRDDPHTYCTLFRATGGGKYIPVSYTPEGRPFLEGVEDPQPHVITPRADAAAQIFSAAAPADLAQDQK